MGDDQIIDKKVYDVQTVDGVAVQVQELTWRSGGKSFDVWEVDVGGEWDDCLTGDASFDAMPTEEQIREVLPPKGTWHFIVTVDECTRKQAERVMTERIGYDEEHGFSYTISHRGPFEDPMPMDEPE